MEANVLKAEDVGRLACPVCRQRLALADDGSVRCVGCGRMFPVIDGIPVLIAERAVNT